MIPVRNTAIIIALTGGVASGKTTVAKRFVDLGTIVIDADVVARDLVAPGMPALAQITSAFGSGLLDAEGRLNRKLMRALVFRDDKQRRRLEAILHPLVRSEMFARAQTCSEPYCMLAIPLLAESAYAYAWVDRVLVIDVPRATQLSRLMFRDGVSSLAAEQMLLAQATRQQRLAIADDVIDNVGEESLLTEAVQRLHERYLQLAFA